MHTGEININNVIVKSIKYFIMGLISGLTAQSVSKNKIKPEDILIIASVSSFAFAVLECRFKQ